MYSNATLRTIAARIERRTKDSINSASDSIQRRLELIGTSPAIRLVQQELEFAARSDAKVLITGESGVGKEVVAQLVHEQSRRARAPLVTINCAGVPDSLLESELFGQCHVAFRRFRMTPGRAPCPVLRKN
jgi:transcriptional regulator with GAF, ATPase, and Fis domain